MPYQALLDQLVSSVFGAQAALLLDELGEVAIEAGARDFRHRPIGAYQGIALATARRTNRRHAAGAVRYLQCRYTWGSVILRPLKDGYYLIVSMRPEVPLAEALWRSAETQERMNDAL